MYGLQRRARIGGVGKQADNTMIAFRTKLHCLLPLTNDRACRHIEQTPQVSQKTLQIYTHRKPTLNAVPKP